MAVFRPESESQVNRLVYGLGAKELLRWLTPEQRQALLYSTRAFERRSKRLPPPGEVTGLKEPGFGLWDGQQEPPGRWLYWLYCGGRGAGKSWRMTRFMLNRARRFPRCQIALVTKTSGTLYDVLNGPPGLMANSPPWFYPDVYPTRRELVFPNKSIIRWYTAEEPDNLRGPNNDYGAIEELCAQPKGPEVWRQLRLTMRGQRADPTQIMIATTPLISDLLNSIYEDPESAVTIGNPYDNAANVSDDWLRRNVTSMLNSSFGEQEVFGHILKQAEGALFKRDWFKREDWCPASLNPSKYKRIGIGIDPARTSGSKADAWGIVKAALREDGLIEVMEDATINATSDEAVERAVALYFEEPSATFMVADVGAGGEQIDGLIRLALQGAGRQVNVLRKSGTKGKRLWAEAAAILYAKHLVFHRRKFSDMEHELCTWTDDSRRSPNHMDALAYVLSELSTPVVSQAGLNKGRTAPRRM